MKEGESLELWCNVDDWWEWCKFTHVPSKKFCDFVWSDPPYNVTVLNCDDFDKRFTYLTSGYKDNKKCGVKIDNVQPDEAGEWKCDLENYYNGYTRGYGYQTNKVFNVDVELKPTTTTTTTTTTSSPAYDDYSYDNYETEEETESSGDGEKTEKPSKNKRRGGMGLHTTYIIIAVVVVVVVCLVIIFAALHYKRKLPPGCYNWKLVGGKSFKPVDQNETVQGEGEDPDEEAKHPSIVKNGGSNGVSPTKEAPKVDEAEINAGLTSVTWSSEKDKEQKDEVQPLKESED